MEEKNIMIEQTLDLIIKQQKLFNERENAIFHFLEKNSSNYERAKDIIFSILKKYKVNFDDYFNVEIATGIMFCEMIKNFASIKELKIEL